ncbi:MAG: di-heme oxidoredictase family protein [Longimicrobiales bacterium]
MTGCNGTSGSDTPEVPREPGDPLPGLSADERARFDAGLALFDRIYTAEEGLGPFFNENQCSACHTDPVSGGSGEQSAIRATRFIAPDRCELLAADEGENLQTNATDALRAHGITARPSPHGATERALTFVPFLFGLGLAEAVPDETLLALADPGDENDDGISGRVGFDRAGRVARFGRKAEHATIADFTAGALLLEMGLTSPVHPVEPGVSGAPLPADADPASDPEVDAETLARLADFVRFLAPLPRRLPEDAALRPNMERGEALFASVGCTGCHVPALETGPNEVAALDRKPATLYSDFLLHDMGPGLAGACGVAASPTEYRTEPLTGVGYRRRLLHDGRTRRLIDAIRAHGGEAMRAKAAFDALGRVEQERILEFLRTL